MKIPEKAKKMINYLQEQICVGRFSSGEKLPSIRNLQDQFDLSYTSANRGVDYLCSIGLTEKRQRSGVFVKKKSNSSKNSKSLSITLFVSGSGLRRSQSIYSTVFLGIQNFAEENKCSLLINYLSPEDITSEIILNASKETDGIIFLSEYDRYLKIFSINIPAVGVCMHNSIEGKLSLLDIDPYQSAEIAVKYFKNKGINCVRIITKKMISYAYKNREDVFEYQWSKAGGTVKREMFSDDFSLDAESGYFFSTSSLLQSCSEEHLKKSGKILSDSAVILGIDGKNLINPTFHNAPAIAVDWQLVGRYAMDECVYRIKHPGTLPKRIYIPGNLVENN